MMKPLLLLTLAAALIGCGFQPPLPPPDPPLPPIPPPVPVDTLLETASQSIDSHEMQMAITFDEYAQRLDRGEFQDANSFGKELNAATEQVRLQTRRPINQLFDDLSKRGWTNREAAIICRAVAAAHRQHVRSTFAANEVEHSRRIAEEWGLDPDEVCEVRTPDGSRVDILTDEYAYEVEWVENWQQAQSQAKLYAKAFNRRPAVLLLMRGGRSESLQYLRCLATADNIRVETYRISE